MRALKVAVVVMGVLLVGGTVTLAVLIAKRLGSGGTHPAEMSSGAGSSAGPVVLDEPAGTRIVGETLVGDRLVLQLQGGGADRVVVIDLHSMAVAGHIGLGR